MSSSKDILNAPSEWPTSFPDPNAGTRVLTYVFKSGSDVEKFLNFVKENYPQALVKVVKDDKGFTNITITEVKNSDSSGKGTGSKIPGATADFALVTEQVVESVA